MQLGVQYFQNNTGDSIFCTCPSRNRQINCWNLWRKVTKSKAICINVGIQFATKCLTALAVGPVTSRLKKVDESNSIPLDYNTSTDRWANYLTIPVLIPNTCETRRKTTSIRPWKRFVNKMFIHWMAATGGNVGRGGNHDNVRVWHEKERTTGYFANVSQLICNYSRVQGSIELPQFVLVLLYT